MSGQQRHVINELRFELQFQTRRAAFARQSDITGFIEQELLPVADRVFDELATVGQSIRIDELEMDLGQVPSESMRPDMTARFEKRLRGSTVINPQSQRSLVSWGIGVEVPVMTATKVRRLFSVSNLTGGR